jgi:hypothetical protein
MVEEIKRVKGKRGGEGEGEEEAQEEEGGRGGEEEEEWSRCGERRGP